MGPACVQIFQVASQLLTDAKESVGARNAKEWAEQRLKLDAVTAVSEMALLIRGLRVSNCHAEGVAKIAFSFSDLTLARTLNVRGAARRDAAPRAGAQVAQRTSASDGPRRVRPVNRTVSRLPRRSVQDGLSLIHISEPTRPEPI
eukprot:4825493-Pyramimonas_sp.AAC.1